MFLDRNLKVTGGFHAQLLAPGTTNGGAVDLFQVEDAAIVLDCGDFSAGAVLDVKLQESDDGTSGWTDVVGAAFTQLVEGTHDNTVHIGSFRASARKRFVRAVAVVANNNVRVGGFFILGNSAEGPVTQDYNTGFRVEG